MDVRVLRVRELFRGVVPNFGVLHAKVFCSLFDGEIKTAKQLSEETGISHNKVYGVLKDLIREKIVFCTNTSPANYHVRNAVKTYEKLVSKR
ncbi:MAG: hypothetical protein JW772_02905, partial [Candidatus Diapherotrites archaeon]|nr:hypothetical protein [Candidatus Diapherotrites archaeon]